jgi:hypothetical protein
VWMESVYLGLLSSHPRCLPAISAHSLIPPSSRLCRCLRCFLVGVFAPPSLSFRCLRCLFALVALVVPSSFYPRSHGFVLAIGTLFQLSALCFRSCCLLDAVVAFSQLSSRCLGSHRVVGSVNSVVSLVFAFVGTFLVWRYVGLVLRIPWLLLADFCVLGIVSLFLRLRVDWVKMVISPVSVSIPTSILRPCFPIVFVICLGHSSHSFVDSVASVNSYRLSVHSPCFPPLFVVFVSVVSVVSAVTARLCLDRFTGFI